MTGRVFRRSGKWGYSLNLSFNPVTGNYTRKSKQGFATKKEAQEALAREQTHIEESEDCTEQVSTHLTMKELFHEWLERAVKPNRAPRTYAVYLQTCDDYLIPHIGTVRLKQLQPKTIEALYAALGNRLAPSTVHRAHRVLRTALNRAVKWGYIAQSPLQRVESPTMRIEKRKPLSSTQVALVLAWLESRYWATYLATYLAVRSGMRRGEIAGLRWSDIDCDHGILSIQRARQRVSGQDLVGPTKTASSIRPIPVDDEVMNLLANWKTTIMQTLGQSWSETSFVVCHPSGELIDPGTISGQFHKAIVELRLPRVSFHDLRHTHATLLLQSRVPMKVVSERLGHSTIQLTANTYSHVSETMQRDAVLRLKEALRQPEQQSPD